MVQLHTLTEVDTQTGRNSRIKYSKNAIKGTKTLELLNNKKSFQFK